MYFKKPLILFIMLWAIQSFAQQQPQLEEVSAIQKDPFTNTKSLCGTPPMTAEQRRYTLEVVDQAGAVRNAGMTAVPIHIHIVRETGATGGISLGDVNIGISYLNYFYKDVGIEFFIADVNYIDDSALYDFETDEEAAMTSAHSVYDAVNIYFVDEITISPGPGVACGYARYPSNNQITLDILMRNNCTTSYANGTLVHELGHFLNLQHTHDGTEYGNSDSDAENVARTGGDANCTTKGDMLCDTEADPNGSNDGSCNYINNGASTQDINALTYAPDLDNIMSYYSDYCGGSFTAEQYTRMANGFATRQGHSAYTLDASVATVTDPSGLAVSLNNSYGIDLTWTDNASNETGYLIERSSDGGTSWRMISGGGVAPDVTTFTDNTISANTTYEYRVKASNDDPNHYNTSSSIAVGLVYGVPTHDATSCTINVYGIGISDFELDQGATNLISNLNTTCNGALTVYSPTINATTPVSTSFDYSITLQDDGGTYSPCYHSIWIDYNQDGDFEDANESVYQSSSSGGLTITGSFTIPATALNGVTTMRVRVRSGAAAADPDIYYSWSEAEDYGLTITGGLPVELVSFKGQRNEDKIKLNWTTASEENNDYFIIERSFNGRDFEYMTRQKGVGTTSELINYQIFDDQPLNGINYYRLVQVDFDGTKHIKDKIIAVAFNELGTVSLFPNPTREDFIQLNYFALKNGDFKVAVYDLDGRIRYEQQYEAIKGGNEYAINLPDWSPGVYLVKVYWEKEVQTIRFVKSN